MSELKCFIVGDHDYVAAFDSAGAVQVLAVTEGNDPKDYSSFEVSECDEETLGMVWRSEEPPHAEVGTLRMWLSEASEPCWLNGTE